MESKTLVQVRWEKPQQGWFRLNTDDSALGNPGKAGGGGIIRDDQGNWVAGFSRNIGFSSSFIAELWALRDGLSLCKSLNLNAVDIQIDAKAIVALLADPSYSNSFAMPIVDDCKQLFSLIPHVRIKHCYREANSYADCLARIGSSQSSVFILYNDPPVDLEELLSSDLAGLVRNRWVTAPPPPSFAGLMKFPLDQKKKKKYRSNCINVILGLCP